MPATPAAGGKKLTAAGGGPGSPPARGGKLTGAGGGHGSPPEPGSGKPTDTGGGPGTALAAKGGILLATGGGPGSAPAAGGWKPTHGVPGATTGPEGGNQAGGPGSVRLALPTSGGPGTTADGSIAAAGGAPGPKDGGGAADGLPTSNSRPCDIKIGISISSAAKPCGGTGRRAPANGLLAKAG